MSEVTLTYRTLSSQSSGLYKEKGSKFIAYAVACYSEEEVKQYLDQWRKEHHQARHLCYAYRLGWKKDRYRANDDGEPNNSAGTPIFGQIQSFDLTNILIGVIRYFGGTKLGVGGLVQAYKQAAQEAINSGEIITVDLKHHFQVEVSFTDYALLMRQVKLLGIDILGQEVKEMYSLQVAVLPMNVNSFLSFLNENQQIVLIDKGIH